jgi:hypothetical protein
MISTPLPLAALAVKEDTTNNIGKSKYEIRDFTLNLIRQLLRILSDNAQI